MTQPTLDNDTDLVVLPHVLYDRDGEVLLTVVKATFTLRRGADQLEAVSQADARPIRGHDIAWGDPETTAPKYPCDVVGRKHATDVVVVAKAHAPDGVAAPYIDVMASVGPLAKPLRIFGPRAWQRGGVGLSAPRPVLEQEIRYDAAWGGMDLSDPQQPQGDMRNPVGRGIACDHNQLSDQLAPAIEDPASPIRNASSHPAPAGYGPLGPHWLPRSQWAGTYDAAWQRDQAPLPPLDFDPRHYQCASPGLVAETPLRGGEPIQLLNLAPGGGVLEATLPRLQPSIEHRLGARAASPGHAATPHLDTLILDTLDVPADAVLIVEMVWRTLTPVPRRLADLEIVVQATPLPG